MMLLQSTVACKWNQQGSLQHSFIPLKCLVDSVAAKMFLGSFLFLVLQLLTVTGLLVLQIQESDFLCYSHDLPLLVPIFDNLSSSFLFIGLLLLGMISRLMSPFLLLELETLTPLLHLRAGSTPGANSSSLPQTDQGQHHHLDHLCLGWFSQQKSLLSFPKNCFQLPFV